MCIGTMDNKEDILDALEEFSEKPSSTKIPALLDQYLRKIATTGETIFPWTKLKPLFSAKLENCIEEFYEKAPTDELPPCPNVENVSFREMKLRLLNAVNDFNNAPFTIQRLCELITDPHKHYKRTDKFMRGIEKNIMVVSCVDSHGTKIVSEGKTIMNGLDTNGEMKTPERKSSQLLGLFAPPPAPTNSPVMVNPFESRLTESTSATTLSPVSVWPLASRFISNNGDGPWPQAAMAAASSTVVETTIVASEMSKTDEPGESSSSRSPVCRESSSCEEKSMEVEEASSSSENMPSTTTLLEKTTVTEIALDLKAAGDAMPSTSEASSTEFVRSDKEASALPVAEEKREPAVKPKATETHESEVSSSDMKHTETKETRVPPQEAECLPETENIEKPESPSPGVSSDSSPTAVEKEIVSEISEPLSDNVTESTSQESVGRTLDTLEKVNEPSPSSESVTSSENSPSEKSEDVSPSSSSSKEESKDTPSCSDEQSSSSPSISDSATPCEAPSEEAMEQE